MSVSGGTMSGRSTGGDPITATLNLLQDTKKLQGRIKSLNEAEKNAQEAISRLGDIQNIASAKSAAQRSRKRAAEVLAEADEKARAIVSEAEKRAAEVKQAVMTEKGNFDREARAKALELKAREDALSEGEKDYKKRLNALQRKESSVGNKAETNREMARDLERRIQALRAACVEAAGDGL